MIDFLGFIIVKIVGIFMRCIPLGCALWIGRRGGDLAYFINSKRRSIAYANLKASFPEKGGRELRKINKAHFRNLAMNLVEMFKFPFMSERSLNRRIESRNFQRIREALDRKKGAILLTAHFGNWEMSPITAKLAGYKMSAFAREQKYPRLNRLLNRYRELVGCKVILKGFSARDIIKELNNNGIVGMLSDQDAGPGGVFVNFLGRPASFGQGVVAFGQKTGASILPSFMWRKGLDRHVAEIGVPLEFVDSGSKKEDMKANLEKIARHLEDCIRRDPSQWLWAHKRWKSTPKRTLLVLSDGKAGHLNQARSVAEMVGEALGSRLEARDIEEEPIVDIEVIKLEFKNRSTRLLLDVCSIFAGRRCQGHLRCLKFCLTKECFSKLKNKYADVIISCGAQTVSASLYLKYENNGKAILIMKPGLGRRRKFDLVILPRHDVQEMPKRNMLITEAAPNRIVLETRMQRGLGLLIGGDAKKFKLRKESVEKVLDGVLRLSEEMDFGIFVSTSRRTSKEIDQLVKDKLGGNGQCRLLVIANEKNPEGIVPAILGQSDVVVVSSESISMISEAASSGRYVVVFRDKRQEARDKGKYERAVEGLEKQGYVRIAEPDGVYSVVKRLLEERPAVKRIEDRGRIVERLEGII